jgi:hypothetical protein
VADWTNIVAISAGTYHTVGLKSDGTVVAVGLNGDGRCDVSDWTNIVAIDAGVHTVGLKADGTVVAIGENRYNQCDVSNWSDIMMPAYAEEQTATVESETEPDEQPATTEEPAHIEWELSEDGTLTISGSGPMPNYASKPGTNNISILEGTAPWASEETRVSVQKVVINPGITSIGDNAFVNCTNLEEVVLPEGIISLDGGCFLGCTSLEKINFPTTLEYIGIYTFDTCKSLKEIELSGNIKEIGMFAFCNTGIKNIKIPASVEVISDLAFNFFNDDLSDKYTAVIENIFVDEENENYIAVESEDILDAVYEIFKARYQDVLQFED